MPKRTPSGRKTAVADVEAKPGRRTQRGQLELPVYDPREIMWAAGFYEGEGAVGERSAIVSQVNMWPLERLRATFGGHIGKSARIDPRRPTRAQGIWQWAICGPEGRNFIAAIYPHLSPRRQAQIDAKFLTWEKFSVRPMSEKRRMHLAKVSMNRNIITGRFGNAS